MWCYNQDQQLTFAESRADCYLLTRSRGARWRTEQVWPPLIAKRICSSHQATRIAMVVPCLTRTSRQRLLDSQYRPFHARMSASRHSSRRSIVSTWAGQICDLLCIGFIVEKEGKKGCSTNFVCRRLRDAYFVYLLAGTACESHCHVALGLSI